MARTSKRSALELSDEERQRLNQLSGSRTAPGREIERAKILLRYTEGASISRIGRELGLTRRTVYKCIDKALAAGHGCLHRAAKATIWRILNAHAIKPHRVRYSLERRDAEFERKLQEVLVVYREIALDLTARETTEPRPIYAVSVDEKPGVQALATTALDLTRVPGEQP